MNTQDESAAPAKAQSPGNPGLAQQGGNTNADIVPANLRAMEAVYFAAMLEEARVFQVVDRLVEMFGQGLLPLGPGKAGATLYRLWKGHHNRLTTEQPHNLYARVFGIEAHDADERPNRKFH